ncbi:MAG TPA: YdeI/OmpD-associated family protein, partial [Vicinamibacterales bacterium]|nr:YdeI/OmpD-associated family protein [Vicinamibacterales bacterium]
MAEKTITTTIVRNGSVCFIPLTFDPRDVFGKVRAPVKVTLNGYTFRSTIAAMGGPACIPLRRSHREAAGLEGGETIDVRLEADTEPRRVEPPPDLVRALKKTPGAHARWRSLSYTNQREAVEAIAAAKTPETRERRIAAAVARASGAVAKDAASDASERIRAYLAALPPAARTALQKLRADIRSAAPDA